MGFSRRILRASAVLISATVLCGFSAAQENRRETLQAPGGTFSRIFSTNYAQPSVWGFDNRGEAKLDSMIRDGKLELSQEDAIRLALENNVDINVERYAPYFSLW